MSLRASLIGSTGLIGRHTLTLLIESQRYAEISAPIRRTPPAHFPKHPKLQTPELDFHQMSRQSDAFRCDVFFCALGTTIKQAGSQKAFYEVDHDFILNAAKLARAGGAKTAVLISAVGADPKSRVFYSRVKGETERDFAALGFERLHILRPSILLGNRSEHRLGEKIATFLSQPLDPILKKGPLARYRPILANRVAQAMIEAARKESAPGVHLYEGLELEALAAPGF